MIFGKIGINKNVNGLSYWLQGAEASQEEGYFDFRKFMVLVDIGCCNSVQGVRKILQGSISKRY